MGTKDITQAARALESAERRLTKVAAAEDAFIEKAKARAQGARAFHGDGTRA